MRPKTILDLGCGTGSHAFPLIRRGYQVTGIDQSRAMLAYARKKVGGSGARPRFVHGRMQSFQLGQTFDAAICMFGAFDYLRPLREAARCLRSVRAHLAPRGLLIFEHWQTSGVRPNHQSWIDTTTGVGEILRLSEATFDSRRSQLSMDFRFLVIRGGKVLDRFSERHVVRTYTRREMDALLRRTGFVRLAEFAGAPSHKRFQRVTAKTFRVMTVVRPRRES